MFISLQCCCNGFNCWNMQFCSTFWIINVVPEFLHHVINKLLILHSEWISQAGLKLSEVAEKLSTGCCERRIRPHLEKLIILVLFQIFKTVHIWNLQVLKSCPCIQDDIMPLFSLAFLWLLTFFFNLWAKSPQILFLSGYMLDSVDLFIRYS